MLWKQTARSVCAVAVGRRPEVWNADSQRCQCLRHGRQRRCQVRRGRGRPTREGASDNLAPGSARGKIDARKMRPRRRPLHRCPDILSRPPSRPRILYPIGFPAQSAGLDCLVRLRARGLVAAHEASSPRTRPRRHARDFATARETSSPRARPRSALQYRMDRRVPR